MVIQVIIPPIPAELIVISAGKVYGVFLTTVVSGTGLFVGSVLVYFLGRYVHTKLGRWLGHLKEERISQALRRYSSILLWIRILPYNPSDVISYTAGIFAFDLSSFLLITFITSYVRCFLLAYLGSQLSSLHALFFVFFILVLSGILVHLFLRFKSRTSKE